MNKLTKTLIELAIALTLLLAIYFFVTYNKREYGKLQSSGDGVYENLR